MQDGTFVGREQSQVASAAGTNHKGTLLSLSAFHAQLVKEPVLASMVAAARTLPAPAGTGKEATALFDGLRKFIEANDRHQAAAHLLVLLRLDGKKWLAKMRRGGMFRASRYGFDAGCLKKLLDAALEISPVTTLSSVQVQYLKSVQALLELARPAKQIQNAIVARLKASKGAALKTLLAAVNAYFTANWMGDDELDETYLQRWSATDLASAFSRLYMISRNKIGIDARTWNWTDDSAASPHEGTYSSLLVDALRINELIDAEVMLDGLPYMAEATATGVLISAIDPEFHKSIKLGYIQTELQVNVRVASVLHHLRGERPTLPSFQQVLSRFFEDGLLEWVAIKEQPAPRFVLQLPAHPKLLNFLNFTPPFLEEASLIHGALIDNFQPDNATDMQVSKHLSVMDLIKAQRMFNVIDTMFDKKLETVTDPVKRNVLKLRSTVMVSQRQDLVQMLEAVMSREKAEELISLLSLPTTKSAANAEDYIDLQDKPFIHSVNPMGDYIAIPPAIVGKSNLVRSIMRASEIKKGTDAKDDPMQKAVAAALREAGFLVCESFTFKFDCNRETDIFCYRDGVLVVIECKNAYHPCSPHELRNSLDLILTGEGQLDIRAQFLADPSFQLQLFKALEWDVATPANVRTCVVTANRLFNGYRRGAHPVRQAHELINVLVRGEVGTGPANPPHRFWGSDRFEIVDLLNYLDGKSVLETQHAAMSPMVRGISLRDSRLEFAEFKMDLTEHHRLMKETFNAASHANALDSQTTGPVPPGAG